jgi:hypothetical protein
MWKDYALDHIALAADDLFTREILKPEMRHQATQIPLG